jgi:CHAT domain-containing protein
VLEQERARRRPDDVGLADLLRSTALQLWNLGDGDGAVALVREALEIRRAAFGDVDPEVAATMRDLGDLRLAAGDPDEAASLFEEALRIRHAALPPGHPDLADSLSALVTVAERRRDWPEAKRLSGEAVEILLGALGEDDERVAQAFAQLGSVLLDGGEVRNAVLPLRRSAEILRRVRGEQDPAYAQALNSLAHAHFTLGELAEAEPLYAESVDVLERAHSANDPTFADVLNNLANVHKLRGDHAAAAPLLARVLEIQRGLFPETDDRVQRAVADLAESRVRADDAETEAAVPSAAVAAELDALALEYARRADYGAAERIARRALAMRREVLGQRDPAVGDSLLTLANVMLLEGRYDEAHAAFQDSLDLARSSTADPVRIGGALAGLAEARRGLGDLAAAERLHAEALELARSSVGERHPLYARALRNLAVVLAAEDRHDEAERLVREARAVAEAVQDDREVASAAGVLASLRRARGDLAGAKSLAEEAVGIRRRVEGEDHPATARSLYDLGTIAQELGELGDAQPLLERAFAAMRAALSDDHPDTAKMATGVASCAEALGDFDRAEDLLQGALSVQRRRLGARHRESAMTMLQLGNLQRRRHRRADAEPLLREAAETLAGLLPPGHPDVVESWVSVAFLYLEIGAFETAEAYLTRALVAREDGSERSQRLAASALSGLAVIRRRRGDLEGERQLLSSALAAVRQSLGNDHPVVATALGELADACLRAGDVAAVLEQLFEAAGIDERAIGQVLSVAGESARLAFLRTVEHRFARLLAIVARDRLDDADAVARACDLVLRRKGLTAEAMALRRDEILGGRHPHLAEPLRELARLRTSIGAATLAAAGDRAGPGPDAVAELVRRRDELERALAHQIPDLDLSRHLASVDRKAVADALPAGSALVELTLADPGPGDEPRYIALVVPAGAPDDSRLIDLGPAKEIDRSLAELRAALERWEDIAAGPGAELYQKVFEPVADALAGRRRLFVAPDAELCQLPLEILCAPSRRYVIDDYAVSYLSAGRDVLRLGRPAGRPGPSVVVADPDFDLRSPDAAESLGDEAFFERLPGTRREGTDVAALLGVAEPLLGWRATEAELKRRRSPAVLHIATHGYFLPAPRREPLENVFERVNLLTVPGEGLFVLGGTPSYYEREELDELGPLGAEVANPLLRSGLALAGANTALRGDPAPAEVEDGILTAEDVSGIDLSDTQLVVLSACETGLGDLEQGEGVFGLRRAFVLAGARTLVISLWKVPDELTQALMTHFYRELSQGRGRADSLRAAQLALKADPPTSHPLIWGAFVCQGDPSPCSVGGVHAR